MFDPSIWAAVPFHFWSLVLFVFGAMVGSFLNVCIHRLPRNESIVSPPSHCPHCNYSIPWYLNIPLATWLWLRGKCANCGAPIAFRYFLVELLTGTVFLATWLEFGAWNPWVALIYCLLFAGFIAATFIDFEHFIIPDQITLGGVVVGFALSGLVPAMHGYAAAKNGLEASFMGIVAGGAILYLVLRGGKLLFGKRRLEFAPGTRLVFGETALILPDREVPYEDLFYRKSDFIEAQAASLLLQIKPGAAPPEGAPESGQAEATPVTEALSVPADAPAIAVDVATSSDAVAEPTAAAPTEESAAVLPCPAASNPEPTPDPTATPETEGVATAGTQPDATLEAGGHEDGVQTFENVRVRLYQDRLIIGEDTSFNPEQVARLELVTDRLVVPQEAMGLGDVKFMAAIGAFVGWRGVVFALLVSSIIGAGVSLALIACRKREWSSLIPYGPYIALAAVIWVFRGPDIYRLFMGM